MKISSIKVAIFDLDDTLFDTTGQLAGSYENLELITPFAETHQVLGLPNITKILVTAGDPEIQCRKIEILGIGRYFRTISICARANIKQGMFECCATIFPPREHQVFAIGNRIDCEIMYGNMCGFTTVLLKHGKYASLVPSTKNQIPTHTIASLAGLLPILAGP